MLHWDPRQTLGYDHLPVKIKTKVKHLQYTTAQAKHPHCKRKKQGDIRNQPEPHWNPAKQNLNTIAPCPAPGTDCGRTRALKIFRPASETLPVATITASLSSTGDHCLWFSSANIPHSQQLQLPEVSPALSASLLELLLTVLSGTISDLLRLLSNLCRSFLNLITFAFCIP